MIHNAREYQVTKSLVARFEDELNTPPGPSGDVHPRIAAAQKAALRGQLQQLKIEIAEYEALVSGLRKTLSFDSLEELPSVLIQARIAAGLSQRNLAKRLGMKEQQIQRYEASKFASASLTRLLQIAKAIGIKIGHDVVLPSADVSLKDLFERLESMGLPRSFVVSRLLPERLRESIDAPEPDVVWKVARSVGRIFDWTTAQLLGKSDLALKPRAMAQAYKVPKKASAEKLGWYSAYAFRIAHLATSAAHPTELKPLPNDWRVIRSAIERRFGSISLRSSLNYVWDLGIVVVPLTDVGAFHAALWRLEGRNVVVLKQRASSQARWMIDLFHEFAHAAFEPERSELAVIETSDDPRILKQDPVEIAATRFASAVVLGGREIELAKQVVEVARRRVPRLKQAVIKVAERENVPADALANYLAFHLAATGEEDWWSTATNLQVADEHPWEVARDVLLERTDFTRLAPEDRDLLERALMADDDGAEKFQ